MKKPLPETITRIVAFLATQGGGDNLEFFVDKACQAVSEMPALDSPDCNPSRTKIATKNYGSGNLEVHIRIQMSKI